MHLVKNKITETFNKACVVLQDFNVGCLQESLVEHKFNEIF